MPIEVRSAITGHSAKMDESAAYGEGMGDICASRGGLSIESPGTALSARRGPLCSAGRHRRQSRSLAACGRYRDCQLRSSRDERQAACWLRHPEGSANELKLPDPAAASALWPRCERPQ